MGNVMATPARESGATRVGPRVFRKHALPFTTFTYKDGRKVTVDPEFARRLKENFDRGVRDIVPVPARGAGGHSNDWRDSKGRTIGVEVDPAKGIFVTVEVDEEAARAIDEKKLGGVSLSFDEDWFDPQAGKNIGPVLRHTALTNINYIQGTDPFAPVDLSDDDDFIILSEAVADPPQEETMEIEAIKKALKEKHGIDYDDITSKAEAHDAAVAKAKVADGVRSALKAGGIELSEDDDPVARVKSLLADKGQLDEKVVSLSERIDAMETAQRKEKAERLVRPYVAKGFVAESERTKMVELAESNYDLAEGVLKGLSKGVLLSEDASEFSEEPPAGSKPTGDPTDLSEDDAAEIKRLAEAAAATA